MRIGLVGKTEDREKTVALGYDELVVTTEQYGQYPKTHLLSIMPGVCPHCMVPGDAITKELGSKLYKDILPESDSINFFYYEFYKYRCANSDCRKMFRQPISFAGINDDATFRLQRRIADLVIEGKSYSWISNAFPEIGTKTTVGNIYRKWVRNNIARVSNPYTPSKLGVFEIPYADGRDSFILFLDCKGKMKVLGVVPSDMTKIRLFLSSLELQKVANVFVNVSPLVVDTITDYMPRQDIVLPVREWLHLVEEDLEAFFKEKTKHCMVPDAVSMLMAQEYAPYSKYNLDSVFQSRPELRDARGLLLSLRSIIKGGEFQWSIEELDEWVDAAEKRLGSVLEVSLKAYREYRDMLYQSGSFPESSGIHWDLENLRWRFKDMNYCTEDFLTGFFLMGSEEYMKKFNGRWYGIPLEVVMKNETVVDYEE